ncbi:MAG: hypothetical protein CL678_03505 [Bdellovibrionaceae bacterium]|nr:hypothetical protein [Pseudobdellovibrionaceae bacterium]|tara:strand:- start:5556 stop:6365 length:810 start_codon:yes stop_codon:yes gene_type:complete
MAKIPRIRIAATFLILFFLGGVATIAIVKTSPKLSRMTYPQIQKQAIRRVKEDARKKKFKIPQPVWVTLAEIPVSIQRAIVFSEDGGFYHHYGVSFEAIWEAAKKNYRLKKYAYGGSTISQQVVKNVFLSKRKTILRKLKELWTTFQMERKLSKDQILEIYLNVAELGPGVYGVRQAAQFYFKKNISQLELAHGLYFALMLPSPRKNYLSVHQNQEISKYKKRKIRRILDDLLHMRKITQEEYNQALNFDYFSTEEKSWADQWKDLLDL